MRVCVDTEQFRVRPETRVRLSRHDPGDTAPFETEKGVRRLQCRQARVARARSQGHRRASIRPAVAGELNHDCMWRCLKALPELVRRRIWYERLEDIRHIERYLGRNGVVIRKFFLNVSKRE
jgi:polyphosphate kinase 2 (PPK2 family)